MKKYIVKLMAMLCKSNPERYDNFPLTPLLSLGAGKYS